MFFPETIETLEQFKQRTSFVHYPFSAEPISINPNCGKKVNERGEFRPFYGDTLVYLLDDAAKERCRYLQDQLYKYCEDVFAEPLKEDTFHLTLHDLNNDTDISSIYSKIEEAEVQVKSLLNSLVDDKTIIKLKSTRIINMVNTSLVLCFEPETDEDCQKLMSYYEMFQKVVPLSYPLTPHITLAYFNAAFDSFDENGNFRNGYIPSRYTETLRWIVEELNKMEPMHIELSVFDLAYQHFSSMNHFDTKYQLKKSILVVDDAAFQRLRIAKVLSELNTPIYAAASGSEMIQMLDEINPSVILLANHLSDIDSTTILEALSEEYPHIKVISMETSTFCHDKAIGFGAVKCLNKTCTDEELLSEVKKLL